MKKLLQKANVYIVGGYVRDRLLGLPGTDHDFVVVGGSWDLMIECGFKPVGQDFPVFLHPLTNDEYALARTERKIGPGYKGFTTDFNSSITLEQDLARRDLTINAMARKVLGYNELGHAKLADEIVDPFNGQSDLKNKILRHTTKSFTEDPLRILRVARFKARYNFDIHISTYELMESLHEEIKTLVPERVFIELQKVCKEPYLYSFFETLIKINALHIIFPSLMICNINEDLTPDQKLINILANGDDKLMEHLKVPTTIKDRVKAVVDIGSVTLTEYYTPSLIFNLFKRNDVYRDPNRLRDILPIISIYKHGLLEECFNAVNEVSFKSIPTSKRKNLTGQEIGRAIDKLRKAKIEQVCKKYL